MANEDKATRYHRLRRRAACGAIAAPALVLLALAAGGGAVTLRAWVEAFTGGAWAPTVAVYALAVLAAVECAQLPFAWYEGVTLEHRYGLATGLRRRWWQDRLKSVFIGAVVAVPAALYVCALLAFSPAYWWVGAAAGATAMSAATAYAAPVLLLPLFYRLERLERPALTARLMTLASRANAKVLGVYEWRLGDQTRRGNAALMGLGRTRRILVSDTLLAEHSDDEVEVILAHELAHHVHRDVPAALAVESAIALAAFLAADAVLGTGWAWSGLQGKSDPAGLPLLVLAASGVSLLLTPFANALSRAQERRADAYAWELTGRPEAFIGAIRKLAARNLTEEQPPRMVELLFHPHPSTAARIAAARAWMASHPART